MDTTDPNLVPGQTVDAARRDFLARFHRPLQKIAIIVLGPLSILLYGFGWYSDRCWQNEVLLVAVVALVACWLVGYRFAVRARLDESVSLFVFPIISFEFLEMMLVDGTAATALLGAVAVTVYAALYSKRYLFLSAAGTFGTFAVAEIVKFVGPYDIKLIAADERMITQVAFALLLGSVVTVILRRSQTINDSLLGTLERTNASQARIIETASRIQPVIDDVAEQIREVSTAFVTQATEQAAATAEVTTTMSRVKQMAEETAATSQGTRTLADATKADSLESRARLETVERGFNDVIERIESARAGINELAAAADNVEVILNFNREIGEQIKILAINAGIEAAKAGQYGTGFRVVATELRSMIANTEENLGQSRRLLDEIRDRARRNAATIRESADLLGRHFEALTTSNSQFGRITTSFAETSTGVGRITQAALQQQVSIDEVSTALSQIDVAATHLEDSARVLLESVETISQTHGELRAVLVSDSLGGAG